MNARTIRTPGAAPDDGLAREQRYRELCALRAEQSAQLTKLNHEHRQLFLMAEEHAIPGALTAQLKALQARIRVAQFLEKDYDEQARALRQD